MIGMQDDVLGEAVKAFVVPRDCDFPDLESRFLQHCRERMPQEFLPRQVVVLDALPKNSTGKVRKEALNELNVPVSAESQPVSVP